jgi:dTDP-4-amino-4,6-dideoxygalactose transaminase
MHVDRRAATAGVTVVAMIPFNRAVFDGNELSYLAQAVTDGHVSGNGPFTRRAEALLAEGQSSGPVLLTTSCTHALELAAALLRIGPGDEVIIPSFTFVSTANAFVLRGAKLVFVDVRPDTLNACPDAVEAAITDRTRAICVVHYDGVGADPDRFTVMAEQHGIALIEDNAHGLFGSFQGRPLGTFGALSTLSFHETKNISCGEGGALTVNDPVLVERAEVLREKGTNRARFLRGQVDKYTWVDVGSSWVMSDLLAGVLVGQLERFQEIHARRSEIWTRYQVELGSWAGSNDVITPFIPDECEHTSHLFHLRLPTLAHRQRFIEHLRAAGIMAVFHYQALHLSPMGIDLGGHVGQCPVSEQATETLVRLPLHLALSEADQARIIEAVQGFRT